MSKKKSVISVLAGTLGRASKKSVVGFFAHYFCRRYTKYYFPVICCQYGFFDVLPTFNRETLDICTALGRGEGKATF